MHEIQMTFDSHPLNEEAWERWITYRKNVRRKPVSETAAKGQQKKLIELSTEVQQLVVDHSIDNDYQGLFPEKFKQKEMGCADQQVDSFIAKHTDTSWAEGL